MGSYVESKDKATKKEKKLCRAVILVILIECFVHMEKKLALTLCHENSMVLNKM